MLKLILTILIFTSNIYAKTPVQIAYTPLEPFSKKSDKGGIVGICPAMAKKVFKDLNLNFKHQVVPWKHTLLNAQKGVIDAIICLSKTEDRLNFLNFSNPIAFAGYYLVTHKDLPKFDPKDKDLIN